jgi:hypothetical protein
MAGLVDSGIAGSFADMPGVYLFGACIFL